MTTFDRSNYVKLEPKRTIAPCDRSDLTVRTRPLEAFIADPERAKSEGKLPLAPPSRPRLGGQ